MDTTRKVLRIFQHDRRPLRRLVAIAIKRSHLGKLIRIRIKDYYIRFHSSSLSADLWYNRNDRASDYTFITTFLRKDDIYVDVGANIGTTVIPAAKAVGEDGRVIAFEPHPRICSYLKENVELNNLTNVEIHNSAVGNERGHVYFSDKNADDMNQVLLSADGFRVPIMLLDDVGRSFGKIALLKIDVEGYEKFVIEGGSETLKNTECVLVEVSEDHFRHFGYSNRDLLRMLEQIGFSVFKTKGPRELLHIESGYIQKESHENAFGIKNVEEFINRTGWRLSYE